MRGIRTDRAERGLAEFATYWRATGGALPVDLEPLMMQRGWDIRDDARVAGYLGYLGLDELRACPNGLLRLRPHLDAERRRVVLAYAVAMQLTEQHGLHAVCDYAPRYIRGAAERYRVNLMARLLIPTEVYAASNSLGRLGAECELPGWLVTARLWSEPPPARTRFFAEDWARLRPHHFETQAPAIEQALALADVTEAWLAVDTSGVRRVRPSDATLIGRHRR